MMRVGIVCAGGYIYGKEVMALGLGQGLQESGHTVQFVTSAWNNGDFHRALQVHELEYRALRLGFVSATLTRECLKMTLEQARHLPRLLTRYRDVLRDFAPGRVIHTNWQHSALLFPLLNPGRDVLWLHEVLPDTARYRALFRVLQRRLGLFVSVSHAVADSLRRIGVNNDKIRVIHNGVRDAAAGYAIQPSNGHRGPRIAIVGQIAEWKGHQDLIDAFAEVAPSHPGSELVIFGRGSEAFESRLRRRAEELGIASRTTWTGFVADPANIYPEMDICVVPSRFAEPFGLVAVEAALFGLPVIATRRGGLPEIVSDGVTGFLCEASAPAQLAAKLSLLCKDAALRRTFGAAAREQALSRFGNRMFVDAFTRVLCAGD